MTNSYVLIAATSTCLVSWVHSNITVKWRNLSGVEYPAAYAGYGPAAKDENAATFNCGTSFALRPSQHTLEVSGLLTSHH